MIVNVSTGVLGEGFNLKRMVINENMSVEKKKVWNVAVWGSEGVS